jgi:NADP-dependent 3-hydroxy acid dehydrogenase YdfG
VEAIAKFSKEKGVDLNAIELDVQSQGSVDKAVRHILADHDRIDVLMHNAGHTWRSAQPRRSRRSSTRSSMTSMS